MYFKQFPTVLYQFEINGQLETRLVRDITANVRFRRDVLDRITLYDLYDIQDGDTPEILAHKIYGNPMYHWVIMLANQRYDYLNDFPMESGVLDQYIKKKYGDQTFAVRHYMKDGFVVMPNVAGSMPMNNYDYEVQQNESKRRIKIIAPELLTSIVSQFRNFI